MQERGGGGDGEGGGGEGGGGQVKANGGGGGDVRGGDVNDPPPPQSVQSVPRGQELYAAPGPPSSQYPSLFHAGLGHALIPPPGQLVAGAGGEEVPKNKNLLSSANARPFPCGAQ